jgi:5'-nucleotidase (lipoprotein e(P4) family)
MTTSRTGTTEPDRMIRTSHTALPIAALFALSACVGPRPAPTATSQLAKYNVNAALYQNASAEVAWLYEQAYAFARVKLDANLAVPGDLPPAVIVDVDETVLDNSSYEVENITMGRVYTDSTWKAWTARAAAPPVPGALAFLEHAVQRGCAVFYITNRHHSEKEATIANLRKHGFPMADDEHVLTMGESSDKTARRQQVQRTHRVVLSVGDQLTDLDQLFRDRGKALGLPLLEEHREALERDFILLPNSVYGYWRDAITGRGTDAEKQRRVEEFLQQRSPR